MSRQITRPEVRTALCSIARRYPDKYNPESAFTTRTGDHCLVGAALEALALPAPPVLSFTNRGGVVTLNQWLKNQNAATFDEDAVEVLEVAMDHADSGDRWADAVNAAVACP